MTLWRRWAGPRIAGRYRRFSPAELAIALTGFLVAAVLLGLTARSASTFNRDIPLSGVTQDIQLDIGRAQVSIFEVLDAETNIAAYENVFANIDHASADCYSLLNGGESHFGRVAPLQEPALRESAALLCEDIRTYRGMVETLLSDPDTNGVGSPFDLRLDAVSEAIVDRNNELARSLDRSIAKDANTLNRLGRTMAGVALLLGLGLTLLVSRHRRVLAAKTQQVVSLASIVQSSADAIVSTSVDGVITSWNPGAEALYGYGADEMIGRHRNVLFAADDKESGQPDLPPEDGRTQVRSYESEASRKDGTRVPLAVTISPIFGGGSIQGFSEISRDISERRAREAELAAARNEALELSRLKSEFLATMSHEIRTPMNGVIGLTGLLLETPLNDAQRQYADGVQTAGEALLTVINDILDFSKLEAGKVELELGEFELRRMVEEVGSLFAPETYAKRLELVAYAMPEVPDVLRGDVGRIRQVLLNLASNAVKFTPQGEVSIKVRSAASDDGRVLVRFQVADTGIGIAEQNRERLFQSFSQADASTTRRYGGTGLGLAISERLVEAMEGQIGFHSEMGSGSTFWFELPLELGSAPQTQTPVAIHDVLTGTRVLVVDDNATNRQILESQLTSWRLLPDVVADAQSALHRMQDMAAQHQPYDVVVLDMCMPDMDGLQLAHAVSADPSLRGVPMIMLTSTFHLDPDALRDAGVTEWLSKPVRSSEFYDRLMRLMGPEAVPTTPLTLVSGVGRVSGSLGRILVVEDNSLNQLVAEGVLSKLGYQVDIVANGLESLEAVRGASYSAVLMDCNMPIMDGFQATREIRQREGIGSRLPIIAMTAGAMVEDRERCLAAGMDDYVSKPVDMHTIENVLARWAISTPGPPQLPEASPAPESELPATSAGSTLDVERLAELRELGSPQDDLLGLVIEAFTRDGARSLTSIRAAADARAAGDLRRAAHELKGASANIGAQQVAAVCHQLEAGAHRLDSAETTDLLHQLEAELSLANVALASVISPHT